MKRLFACCIAIAVMAAVVCMVSPSVLQAQTGNIQQHAVTSETIAAHPASELRPAAPMSAAQHQQLEELHEAQMNAILSRTPAVLPGPTRGVVQQLNPASNVRVQPRFPEVTSPPAGGVFPAGGTVYVGRNIPYTVVGDGRSSVFEPANASDGPYVFYSANWNRGYATDGGSTWTTIPDDAGPAFAPLFCCDQDVYKDEASETFFWSELFCNASCNVGDVRIHVRNLVSGDNCYYDIDPDPVNHLWIPDYPHIRGSYQWLYLSTNEISTGGSWVSKMRRLNINQMANCVTAATQTFTYTGADTGQRVFSPAAGASDTMFFEFQKDSTTLRVFKWSDSGVLTSADIAVQATNNGAGACFFNGVNWQSFFLSTSVHGFTVKSTVARDNGTEYVAVYWNGAQDAFSASSYSHAALIRATDFALLSQPHLANGASCIGYVNVASNENGDIGFSGLFGSCPSGSCGIGPATGFIGIGDALTCSTRGNPCTAIFTATANQNASRMGDYTTVNRGNTCRQAFVASVYGLLNGGVNARSNEFVDSQGYECYRAHKGSHRIYP